MPCSASSAAEIPSSPATVSKPGSGLGLLIGGVYEAGWGRGYGDPQGRCQPPCQPTGRTPPTLAGRRTAPELHADAGGPLDTCSSACKRQVRGSSPLASS